MALTDQILVVVKATGTQAMSEFDRLEKSAKNTDTAFTNIGKSLKTGLAAGAAALVGTGLVKFLGDSVDAYGDAAKAAGDLAKATGGSVDEVSRLQAALQDAGISAEQSAGLMTKFTTNFGKNKELIEDLGVVVKTNKDGTIDYADAMVQAVDATNKIGDASKRQKTFVDLFGKAGAQAFQDLAASGVTLSDAMAAISKYRVFTAEDVAKAAAYDEAMDSLGASTQGLQFAIGEALVPALSGLIDVFSDVVSALSPVIEFLGEIPTEMYLVVGAAVALNAALKTNLVTGIASVVGTFVTTMITGMVAVGTGAITMAEVFAGAMRAMTAALVTNPVGLVLAAIAATVLLVMHSVQARKDQLKTAVEEVKALEQEGMTRAAAIEEIARKSDASKPKGRKAMEGGFEGKELRDEIDAINKAYDEYDAQLTTTAALQQVSADAQEELTTAVRDFVLGGGDAAAAQGDLAEKTELAATAQHNQTLVTDLAKGLMDAYAASTWDAVDATESMFDAQHRAESAQRGLTSAIEDYNKERSAENAAAVVDAVWDLADASTAAWVAEEKRYGRVPSDMAIDAHRLEELKNGITQLPKGSAVAQDMMDEFSRTVAAFATANPTTIPIGWSVEDWSAELDTQIANIKAQIENPETTPEQKVNLRADLTALETAKTNITNGTATPMPVTTSTDTTEAETAIANVTAGENTANLTVTTAFEPGGYEAVKSRIDYILAANDQSPDINVYTHFHDGSYEAVVSRLDHILSYDGKSPDIDIWTHFHPDSYNDIVRRLDNIARNRTATIDIQTRGLSAAEAAIRSITTPSAAAVAAQQIILQQQTQPINLVKVSVDGQQLDARIRDQLLNVRRSDDLAAAMGVVA